MPSIRGKSLRALSRDISDGYVAVNPLFLKPFDAETLKQLYHEVMKTQGEIRGEKFPYGNVEEIRWRNFRLQRLHSAAMIIKTFARDRKITLI
ncbi:MAG: hypothetical protein ABSA46_17680 [Thermodesulfovibrionales bacterium]